MSTLLKPSDPPSGGLAKKFVAVMQKLGYIPKSGRNTAQNYDFVTDADVMDKVREALVAVNVATITGIIDIQTEPFETAKGSKQFLTSIKGYIEFVDADTGESYVAEGVGQGADAGDKGVYKAITGLTKYVLLKTFLIPTGDDPERDDPPAPSKSTPPATPTDTTAMVNKTTGLTPKQRALLMAKLHEAGITDDARSEYTYSIVGKRTTKEMNGTDLDALLNALDLRAQVAAIMDDKSVVIEADGMPA